jgi:hypothetical protein
MMSPICFIWGNRVMLSVLDGSSERHDPIVHNWSIRDDERSSDSPGGVANCSTWAGRSR